MKVQCLPEGDRFDISDKILRGTPKSVRYDDTNNIEGNGREDLMRLQLRKAVRPEIGQIAFISYEVFGMHDYIVGMPRW
jgi:hypothetical protein